MRGGKILEYYLDGIYMDCTEVEKVKSGKHIRYNLYQFRDLHTNEVHYIYDHRCNKVLLEEMSDSDGLVYRVSGEMTVNGMQHFCNLGSVGIIDGDVVRWLYKA